MVIKLDLKDKKILYELDKNCRQSNAKIARKVELSKQVVGQRIQKMIENKLITTFYAVIDISKLGFTVHKNFLRLQNITKEKEKELIEYAKSNPNVVWATSCDGRYDFIFSTWAKDPEHLNNILKELNKKFGEFIYERQIATILKGQYLARDYLLNKKRNHGEGEVFFGAIPESINLDKTDWKILMALGQNARMSAVDIASKAHVSADVIGDRIRKLERIGVLKHYNFVPNESVYPYLHYKILISLRNNSEQIEGSFLSYCRSNPNIVYVVKALGSWDFEVDIELENIGQFREIMMGLKSHFQNDMRDYSSLLIYQVHKYNFCPGTP